MFTSTFTSRARARAAATGAVGAALVVGGLAAMPAHAQGSGAQAPSVNAVSVSTASTKVTSSTGHHLTISVYAFSQKGGHPSISVSLRTTQESHGWSFTGPRTAVAVDSTGKGSITLSGTQMGGYGHLKLHLKPVGKARTQKCGGEPQSKTRPVTVSGTMFFNTKSTGTHKWGTVGSNRKTFTFARTDSVTWTYNTTHSCPSPPPTCYTSRSWSRSVSTLKTYTYLSGGVAGKAGYVSAFRSTQLSKPKGASRYDSMSLKAKPSSLTVANDGSAVMKVFLGTGSATLKAPPGSTFDQPCGTGTKQEHTTSWSGSYQNGPKQLRAPAQIFGSIALPNSSDGGFFSRSTIIG